MEFQSEILSEFIRNIHYYYDEAKHQQDRWYPMFNSEFLDDRSKYAWVKDNHEMFLKDTQNDIISNRWYFTESGYITALKFTPNGNLIIVAHSTGLIQVAQYNTNLYRDSTNFRQGVTRVNLNAL